MCLLIVLTRHGWRTAEEMLEPVWSCGPVLPMSLVGISHTVDRDEGEEEEEGEFYRDDI